MLQQCLQKLSLDPRIGRRERRKGDNMSPSFSPGKTQQLIQYRQVYCLTTQPNPVNHNKKVIAAAQRGFQASGFELNPWLVLYSRHKAWREGVYQSTSFHISDLWKVSFAQYSNIVIFGVPQMMDQLELKLASELPSTAKVVACRFPFTNCVPEHTAGEGIDTVWVYDAETFKSLLYHGKTRITTPEHGDIPDSYI
ncbi:ATP synthase subunit C lysine N-methyltransferase-like isoform 2-T2 [Aulostomus maculatus]